MLINVYSLALMQNHYQTTILVLSNCHNQTHVVILVSSSQLTSPGLSIIIIYWPMLTNPSICSGEPYQKKKLYISLVRSRLIYSSQLSNPYLIKDIVILERIQRHATKFILNDYSSNYKSHLLKLNILPLMYQFDYYDILFFIKHIKYPTDNFNIFNHVTFSHGSTRSSSHSKLHHKYSANNLLRNSYFCRLPKIWNSLPPIDLNQSDLS